MSENTLPKLEQMIELIIDKNTQLKNTITELESKNKSLSDEIEVYQLEVLESEEQQKQTNEVLSNLVGKLQSVQELA